MTIKKVALASSVVLVSLAAATYCHLHSILNLHYDGVAHLNIARRILDHPVPHVSHLGTVWLPLHHLLLLPWVQNDFLWSRGLAGTFVSMPAFWLACYFLFKLSVHLHGESMAGFFSVIAFASNSNILYLQSTPLGEMLYIALFLMSLSWLLKAAESAETSVLPAATAIALASLTRYDGWLLPPLGICVLVLSRGTRHENITRCFRRSARFLVVACLGIFLWLAYNWLLYHDAFSFAHGEYSTQQNIARILLEAGLKSYPPRGNFVAACHYYLDAALLSAGLPLLALGCLGLGVYVSRSRFSLPVVISGLCFLVPPGFYIANLLRGTGIIYVPTLPPYGILNVRYMALFLPGLCLFAPAGFNALLQLTRSISKFFRDSFINFLNGVALKQIVAALLLVGIAVPGFMGAGSVPFYREAFVNGFDRRRVDFDAATFLKAHYDGRLILMDLGQHGIIPQQAEIALMQFIHEGTDWQAALAQPSLFVNWIIVQEGDGISRFPIRWENVGLNFKAVFRSRSQSERPLTIYRKILDSGLTNFDSRLESSVKRLGIVMDIRDPESVGMGRISKGDRLVLVRAETFASRFGYRGRESLLR